MSSGNAYESPRSKTSPDDSAARLPSVVWPAVFGIGQGLSWGGAIWLLLLVEPVYEQVFKDFKRDSPSITKKLIDLANFIKSDLPLVVLIVLTWMLLSGFVVWWLDRRRAVVGKIIWYSLTWLAAFGFVAMTNVAFLVPFSALMRNLSGQ